MNILMEALRTFSGMEGFIKKGSQFNVSSNERAKQLSVVGLAKMVNESVEEEEIIVEVPSNEEVPDEIVPEVSVSLIEPVSMQVVSAPSSVSNVKKKPTIIWTGDPNKELPSDFNRLED